MNEMDRATSVFVAAVALAAADRAAYLDQVCAGDLALRQRVEALLRAHDRPGHFLDQPAAPPGGTVEHVPDGVAGSLVAGRYKLLERIGEGGMGTVWMAEQREPVKRLVALKLIKPGMDSQAVLARFEAERQALALMDHPHIAKVLDGGTTDNGRPYFVMELVKGLPLTDYCDNRRLSVPDRLQLFVHICTAVQHAHQKGIIHRDLKPSNLLVTEHDGKPVPKVIDFGLAKALGAATVLTERTLHTAYGTVVGTPLYMAPEQVGINALDVDTRTDIYALGAILYELLTGTTPLEKRRYQEAAWEEVKRLIREVEPPKPSLRLSSSDALPSLAARRQTEPAKLSRLVRGDLDWIVLKALEKDRNRRYETANGLAMDVQRHLAGEPVLAAPPSVRYRLQKFLRKHRGPVLAASLVLLALLTGIAGTTWGLVEAMHQRDAADEARAKEMEQRHSAEANAKQAAASALQEARQRQIAQAIEIKAKEAAEEERQAKDREAKQRQAAVAAQKRAMEALRATTDDVIELLLDARPMLGPTEKAFLQATLKRWQVFAADQGESPVSRAIRAEGLGRVAFLHQKLGELKLALAYNREAIRLLGKLTTEFPTVPVYRAELANAHTNLGTLLLSLGKRVEAAEQYDRALGLQEQLAAEFPADPAYRQGLARSHANLGLVFQGLGKRAEGVEQYRQALALLEQLAADFPDTPGYRDELAACHNNLGYLLQDLGKSREAAEQYSQALGLWERLAAEIPAVPAYRQGLARSHTNLGALLMPLGQRAEAEKHYRLALGLQEQLVADFPAVPTYRQELARSNYNLGNLLKAQGKGAEAEQRHRKALGLQEKLAAEFPAVPDYRHDLARSHFNLGALLHARGQPAEAEEHYRQALALLEKLAADFPAVAAYRIDLGGSLLNFGTLVLGSGKPADSLPWYARAIATLAAVLTKEPDQASARHFLRNAHWGRAQALDQLGLHEDAVKDWDQAVALSPAALQGFFKAQRALSQVKAGQVAEAIAAVAQLAKSTNWPATAWYDFARVYALASAQDHDKKETYASRAVELLQRAVQTGYNNVDHLKQDADLNPLRGRDDFQKIIEAVSKAKNSAPR
jgi:serine/threonine protein kinase/tetratricopeptide (TPR) repeat protein